MVGKILFLVTITFALASGRLMLPHMFERLRRTNSEVDNNFKSVATDEKVKVDLYYETLCPGCIHMYAHLKDVFVKLGDHLEIKTYPYGNAKTEGDKVTCQHREPECYGNKLHACAIDILKDISKWLIYNACMMESKSNDEAADNCGKSLEIDSAPIKECAKGKRGQQLLIEYGKLTPADHKYTPWTLINGKLMDLKDTLLEAVCKGFKNPPSACS